MHVKSTSPGPKHAPEAHGVMNPSIPKESIAQILRISWSPHIPLFSEVPYRSRLRGQHA
jgi:hypothetical protein